MYSSLHILCVYLCVCVCVCRCDKVIQYSNTHLHPNYSNVPSCTSSPRTKKKEEDVKNEWREKIYLWRNFSYMASQFWVCITSIWIIIIIFCRVYEKLKCSFWLYVAHAQENRVENRVTFVPFTSLLLIYTTMKWSEYKRKLGFQNQVICEIQKKEKF